MSLLPLPLLERVVRRTQPQKVSGRVNRVAGLLVEGSIPGAHLGMVCRLQLPGADSRDAVPAEVVALRGSTVSLMPLGGVQGIRTGTRILSTGEQPFVAAGPALLGRVLDGWGNPMDGLGPVDGEHAERYPLDPPPLNPLRRSLIAEPLSVGIRSIDALLTCGQGQRLAIMAGAGVGKSTLLGMMARNTEADVTVIALVGERSREVKRFVEHDLGTDGLVRAVVVSATSDHAPALRVRAARVATAIAEYFRDRGQRVLLLMDSLTRVAMAQRELGLAVGEPPATKGYPPSAFAIIPRLLERAGTGVGAGSITGFYTTLLEGDDLGDPVGDAVRATTDGHIVLSRGLADRGHFPAVDVLPSVSRVMPEVVGEAHVRAAQAIRALLADYAEIEDMDLLGAYTRGSNPRFDRAIQARPEILAWLRQDTREAADMDESVAGMSALAARFGGKP